MNKTQPQMDWQQVVLNGGPPCLHIEGDRFCGRAERWQGHGVATFHDFVSLEQYVSEVRRETWEATIAIVNAIPAEDGLYVEQEAVLAALESAKEKDE